jgi:hypothetical protein
MDRPILSLIIGMIITKEKNIAAGKRNDCKTFSINIRKGDRNKLFTPS